MNKKIISKIVNITLVFLMVGAMFASLPNTANAATTIYVPDNYPTIQAAVNAASPGDTIIVRDGTYTENVNVSTDNLTIRSENGAEVTIVQALNSDDHVFEVSADYVNIGGFSVQGATGWEKAGIFLEEGTEHCTISNNDFLGNCQGVHLFSSHNNTIANNKTYNNNLAIILVRSNNNMVANNTFVGDGIYVLDSYQNTVTDNTLNGKPLVYLEEVSNYTVTDAGQVVLVRCNNIVVRNLDLSNTHVGIELWETNSSIIDNNIINNGYSGIHLLVSCNNFVTNNDASNNSFEGIKLWLSGNNEVMNNDVSSNGSHGLTLAYSNNNILKNNIVANNPSLGIFLWGDSSNNEIYLNNLIANGKNVYNLSPHSPNTWNSPEEITYTYNGNTYTNYLGNYWDDYAGSDADGDGIGDTPYPIDSDKDSYPLMEPWENYFAEDILDYYRGLGDYPDVVETQDLLKAANDWANEVAPPGFNEPITTVQLLQLANEWAAG